MDLLNPDSHGNSRVGRLCHPNHRLKDHVEPTILALMTSAGFVEAKKLGERGMLLGRVGFFRPLLRRQSGCDVPTALAAENGGWAAGWELSYDAARPEHGCGQEVKDVDR